MLGVLNLTKSCSGLFLLVINVLENLFLYSPVDSSEVYSPDSLKPSELQKERLRPSNINSDSTEKREKMRREQNKSHLECDLVYQQGK